MCEEALWLSLTMIKYSIQNLRQMSIDMEEKERKINLELGDPDTLLTAAPLEMASFSLNTGTCIVAWSFRPKIKVTSKSPLDCTSLTLTHTANSLVLDKSPCSNKT